MKKIIFTIASLMMMSSAFSQAWLNKAVVDGRVDSVWAGYGLPSSYTGEGVIIGLTDWGFDYTHPVFYDSTMTRYRVLRAWDQFKTSGPAPAGYDYGTEYVGADQLLAALCDTANFYDYAYHGTHCASIAGGAGAGTQYKGVAPEAEFLFATIDINDNAVRDAWNWMYQVAQQEGKRLVISMSWGVYSLDNMDGTGVLAEEVRRLTDLGVVFVTSAGNNGDVNFHVKYDFNQSNDTMRTQFYFPASSSDLWGSALTMMNSANSPFQFAVEVMNGSYERLATSGFISTENSGFTQDYLVVNGDSIPFDYEIRATNEYNHAPSVQLRVKKNTSYKFCLAVTAQSGTFHAWNVAEITKAYGNWGADFVAPAQHPDWIAGDNEYGISTPGNIDEIITIAAHRAQFVNNFDMTVGGEIADFSSSGPGFHDLVKPEISACGKTVVSAISSYTNTFSGNYTKTIEFNGRNYRFASLSGTSMSAPFVAGVVALVLQANPYLSTAQVKSILTNTAHEDSFTEEAGVNRFGYGKVNAYQAVIEALRQTGVENHTSSAQSQYSLFPNPTNGSCYVTVKSSSESVRCQVFDLTGRLLESHSFTPGVNTLNMNDLPSGCYLLRFQDGQSVVSKKLIKQ